MSAYVANLNYVFSPSAGTVNFSGNAGFQPRWLKALTNQTQNTFIYLPGIPNYGGTWDSTGTILTLQANVSAHNATDLLLIQYDDQTNSIADQVTILTGQNVGTSLSWQGNRGAICTIPNVEDTLQRLIAEVRLLCILFATQAGLDVDLDAAIQSIVSKNLKS